MRGTIPRIPHLPGSKVGDDDLVLAPHEAAPFFSRRVVVSEKTDGISLTVRLSPDGEVRAGLKADWLPALGGRVLRAADLWVRQRERELLPLVDDGTHVYGEWLWHRLELAYERLPSAALLYGIRDPAGRLVPRATALARLRSLGLPVVEPLFVGVIGARPLASFCRASAWGGGVSEGIVVELADQRGARWAKWVRAGYRQPTPRTMSGARNRVLLEG
ncbi:MAG: hypothetical protein IT383_27825 [Deltaproteobacteria bacterium]|nr:hypothetical protein [Deltaproteobacteria bacterium]